MFSRLTTARLTLSKNRQTHTYSTLIHIYRSKQWDSKEYYQRDLSSERPRDCSILELCRNICILQQPFHCSVGLSHPDECFWFFGIRWLTYDYPWWRDLTDDALILEALHHYKPILDRQRRTKCSVYSQRANIFLSCIKLVLELEGRVRDRRSEEQPLN